VALTVKPEATARWCRELVVPELGGEGDSISMSPWMNSSTSLVRVADHQQPDPVRVEAALGEGLSSAHQFRTWLRVMDVVRLMSSSRIV
jgi:hypothetical protein